MPSPAASPLALALTLAVAGPATASKHGKSGKPKVALLTTSQSALTDGGKLKVKVKSKRTLKTKLSVALKQGGEKTGIAKPKKLKLKKGKPLTARFAIKDKAEPLLRSCLGTHIHASITYKSKQGKSGSATRKAKKITVTDRAWRKRDPARSATAATRSASRSTPPIAAIRSRLRASSACSPIRTTSTPARTRPLRPGCGST